MLRTSNWTDSFVFLSPMQMYGDDVFVYRRNWLGKLTASYNLPLLRLAHVSNQAEVRKQGWKFGAVQEHVAYI